MKILISGCSFTQWPEEPGSSNNICWPAHLQRLDSSLEITNLAEPGAGNQYISDSIVQNVLRNRPDHVLVMWSGVSRLDFLTSLKDPAWERMFDSYGFYRRVDHCPTRLGYIFSGGRTGTWHKNAVAQQMFTQMYKVSDPLNLASINLMEIVKCQSFLLSKNIPYHFMSYVNYWNNEEWVSSNGDFGVIKYPELSYLINEIDFSKWIFTNDRKDGIYELAKLSNSYYLDKFHPGVDIQEQWAGIVNERLKRDRLS